MAAWKVVLAAVLALSLSACMGGSNDNVSVRVTTPTPTTIPPTPEVTPTPEDPAELVISGQQVYQGGALLVSVTGDVELGSVQFMGREHELRPGERSMYTFVGVAPEDAAGASELLVSFETLNGSRGELRETVDVLATQWEVDELHFEPGEADGLLDPEVSRQEMEVLRGLYAESANEKLWEEPWLIAAEGTLTSRFGSQRLINGEPAEGHHGGTDIGAETGTPVVATNHGRVVAARVLQVRGNMVIVDHGNGVLSGYAHLDSMAVTEGEDVVAGEQIGTVGNTGRSTGSHLHWEMAIHGVLVDPWRFVDGSNGF